MADDRSILFDTLRKDFLYNTFLTTIETSVDFSSTSDYRSIQVFKSIVFNNLDRIQLVDKNSNTSYSQVGFMAAVIGLSYIRASRIDGRIFRYFCGIDTNRTGVHGLHDKKRDTSPEKSVGENERPS